MDKMYQRKKTKTTKIMNKQRIMVKTIITKTLPWTIPKRTVVEIKMGMVATKTRKVTKENLIRITIKIRNKAKNKSHKRRKKRGQVIKVKDSIGEDQIGVRREEIIVVDHSIRDITTGCRMTTTVFNKQEDKDIHNRYSKTQTVLPISFRIDNLWIIHPCTSPTLMVTILRQIYNFLTKKDTSLMRLNVILTNREDLEKLTIARHNKNGIWLKIWKWECYIKDIRILELCFIRINKDSSKIINLVDIKTIKEDIQTIPRTGVPHIEDLQSTLPIEDHQTILTDPIIHAENL